MDVATRNRLVISIVFLLAAGFIAVQMFYSLTPPRHADHDHAMASLDAGGFLWLESFAGDRRNLVGRPGKVLVLHWFDPAAPSAEEAEAARFAVAIPDGEAVEVVLVAQTQSREGLEAWAQSVGASTGLLYLDPGGRTAELIGVRRLPETLIYDPAGLLAYQARGPLDWAGGELAARIQTAKAGVREID